MALHKHYDALTRRERLAVYLQALGRGDRQEAARVLKGSRRVEVEMIDLYPDCRALDTLHLLHQVSQMDAALAALSASRLWDKDPRALLCSQYLARRYVAAEEAWRSLCEEYGLDHEGMRSALGAKLLLWGKGELIDLLVELELAEMPPGAEGLLPELPTAEGRRREYEELLVTLREVST